ncbi:UNVERIFIED_CONTAM: Pentatricopeptide repeat-containing protein, mitochondrial [Sesamum latifolium]|uniref:Pentatricopeptide repeat-containing protein, mitochondrial n=1 Tax=Sesamum latifolium TaxID=2727402 RepID=A0AAW2X7G2_9LAMI
MRRNLRWMPSVFHALRDQIYFINKSQYVEHPLRFLSRHPSVGTCVSLGVPHLTPPLSNDSLARLTLHASFNSSVDGQGEADKDVDREFESDVEDAVTGHKSAGEFSSRDLGTLMDILRTGGAQDKSKKLEQCGVNVTPALVANVLSGTRNDWETAFTFFLWASKQPGYQHSLREYHSMIAILGKFRKFDTAWSLIDDMRAASLVTPHTLLIMIRRYAAVHDVAKAINTFYGLRRFKFEIGMEEFQGLLSALCRYKNVKDAEHLLFCNKTVFPLNTKSFNIILNGWCNVIGDLREGKRIWREMEERGIRHDVYSYGSIISCHSKVNHLNIVLRLYEEMKAHGIKPDKKVYNAMIHALAKGRLVKEAWNLMKTMEEEGFTPDAVTYNSLIMPLCKSRLLDEAKQVFDEMTEKGLRPTVRTYHAFFRVLRTGEEVFELLQRMRMTGCHPSHDTYIMLIRKFCRWRQLDNVFKLWTEMSKNGLDPDRSSYIVLIHGLFLNGRLEEAHKYYLEMKEKHLLPEPKIDAMLQAWVAGKTDADWHVIASKDNQLNSSELGERTRNRSKKNHRDIDFRRQPELRSVTRDRGFSFWDP